MLAPSEYQARCDRCGYRSSPWIAGCSEGIFVQAGPRGLNETYSHLRLSRTNVVCTCCGTLYPWQHVTIDYPLKPSLVILFCCFVFAGAAAVISRDLVTAVVCATVAVVIAMISIRVFRKHFAERIRTTHAQRIAEMESQTNKCPQCGSADAIALSSRPQFVRCPKCEERTLSIVHTFKGSP